MYSACVLFRNQQTVKDCLSSQWGIRTISGTVLGVKLKSNFDQVLETRQKGGVLASAPAQPEEDYAIADLTPETLHSAWPF